MPKLQPRDKSEALGRLIWNRTAAAIPAAEYARRTGRTAQTILNHKRHPESMKALDLIAYANASGMTDEEWIQLRGIK